MKTIRSIEHQKDIFELLNVIRKSFRTVAEDLNLTQENAPTHPSFLTQDRLEQSIKNGLHFFVMTIDDRITGCIAIQKGDKPGLFYIERLAVLPEFRHNNYGRDLMDHAVNEIKIRNGTAVSIGIINEAAVLKKWYAEYGFVERSTKVFNHLPFTVCIMEKSI